MIEIDLLRHVKVVGEPALYGRTDIAPIAAENTRLLARLVAGRSNTPRYHNIICSPLARCQNLALDLAKACDIPLVVSPSLQEMNFGCFDGVPFDRIPFAGSPFDEKQNLKNADKNSQLTWSRLEDFFQTPAENTLPEAETLADFHQRVIQGWHRLVAQQLTDVKSQAQTLLTQCEHGTLAKPQSLSTPRRVLIIAHGGVIRMILAHILQLDWQQASWHQQLKIGHGSLSRICVSQPYPDKHDQQPQFHQQLHQEVKTIAMPLLEEF
ncbi:histidine phosphatase family protein [Colwellia piezophila]|uniref:histidine phosphatase family protein n=1 Tax=Colwellia piezophila TaxID=211668 RepID=UPI00037B547E|nr:histidine phosphatase family protein [Colwellia piezophila]